MKKQFIKQSRLPRGAYQLDPAEVFGYFEKKAQENKKKERKNKHES